MNRKTESISTETSFISLNSLVCLEDIDSGERFNFYLVAPDDMDTKGKKLSISSPLGHILAGQTVGATVSWSAPSRIRRFKIKAIRYEDG